MRLPDALNNWLQIKIVWDKRPNDLSARDTCLFFSDMLHSDYDIDELVVRAKKDAYIISYKQDGQVHEKAFDAETAERLWQDIESEPKYNLDFSETTQD